MRAYDRAKMHRALDAVLDAAGEWVRNEYYINGDVGGVIMHEGGTTPWVAHVVGIAPGTRFKTRAEAVAFVERYAR
jgi:hypothetical protein